MQLIDFIIVVTYFVFVIGIGFMFRSQVTDVSEYFRGGGKLLWWMTGSSVFMTTFSAWTFTGAAGKAYEDGLPVMVIFIGNMAGYFFSAYFLAGRLRQLRVDTPMEAYKLRFGRFNEQLVLWITVLNSLLPGGISLVAVSIFVSAIFGWDLQSTIMVIGGVVLFVTLTGGAWAVIASDFIQALLVVAITIVVAIRTVMLMGGVSPIFEQFPADNVLVGNNVNYTGIFLLWCLAAFVQRLLDVNHLNGAARYLATKDSANAKKAALLAACLFGGASLIWFLPPMASASLFPELSTIYPELTNPSEAAYLVFVQYYMPPGILGLLVAAMFAATMSSMDSSTNMGSAMFTKCFYKPLVRPQANRRELLLAGRISTFVIGIVKILIALAISQIEQLSLFNFMLTFIGLFSVPMVLPAVLSFVFRRTPDWAAWSTILVGFIVSTLVSNVFNADWVASNFGLDLTDRESSDLNLVITYAAHLTITVSWFLSTMLFHSGHPHERQEEIDQFYRNFDTPVVSTDELSPTDILQRRRLGFMAIAFGGFAAIVAVVQSFFHPAYSFFAVASLLLVVGCLLLKYRAASTSE